jgi:hypothetical protein
MVKKNKFNDIKRFMAVKLVFFFSRLKNLMD